MLLMLDNYDSFTYNLVHLLEVLGAEVAVYRNDALTVDGAEALGPSHLVVSPGPGRPAEAGISVELIRRLGPGETTRCVGASASASSTVIASLRNTRTSAPSSSKRWTRL